MALTLSTAARNAAADAVVDLLDAGTTNTYPALKIATAAFGATLATIDFTDATAFGASASGTATAGTMADDTSASAGTAAVFECVDQDNTRVFEGTVTATGGGGDIELSSVSIGAGDTVSITSLTYTQPAS